MKKYLLLGFFIALFSQIFSQAKNVVSFPSPDAAELGKYGQIPVSFFNGLPQISIPLYTIKTNNLSLPISLSYYAQGNKPDEHPGSVGLGWNLNAGGMITRIVNGERDEIVKNDVDEINENYSVPFYEIGYFYRMNSFNSLNWDQEIIQELLNSDIYNNEIKDTEPDEFIFNFNGISGSFYFVNNNGQVDVKIKSKEGLILKVEPEFFEESFNLDVFGYVNNWNKYKPIYNVNSTFKKFVVTSLEGVKYVFGGDKTSIDFTTSAGSTKPRTIATTWHLTKIISPYGDNMSFQYTTGEPVFIQNKSNYKYISAQSGSSNPCFSTTNFNVSGFSINILHPKYLNNITTSENQIVNFDLSDAIQLDYNWNIFQNDPYKTLLSAILPKYLEPLPIDYIDFTNHHRYKKIDRIKFEGIKAFNFFYSNIATQRLKLFGVSLTPCYQVLYNYSSDINNEKNDIKYSFFYNNTDLPPFNSQKTDNWGFFNDIDYSVISDFNDYDQLFNIRVPILNKTEAEILGKIIYPTGGSTTFEYQLNDYSKIVNGLEINEIGTIDGPFTIKNISGVAGGLRIYKIKNFPNADDTQNYIQKTYRYLNEDNTSSGILSGIPAYKLTGSLYEDYFFSDFPEFVNGVIQGTSDVSFFQASQNQLLPLSKTDGNDVTYSRVIEENNDGSKIIYTYTNHSEKSNETPIRIATNLDSRILTDSWSSKELERGLLMSVIFKNSTEKTVKEISYMYNDDANRYNNFVKVINRYALSANQCGLDIFRFSANKIYTFYPYLKRKTETIRNANGENPVVTITDFKYDNNYNLPIENEIINSNNVSLKNKITYPFNYSFPNYLEKDHPLKKMTDKFMLNYPIEQIGICNSKIISAEVTAYLPFSSIVDSNMPVKSTILKLETTAPLISTTLLSSGDNGNAYTFSPYLKEYVKYNFYSNSNIKEIIDLKKNLTTTYLWSYNNRYPIVEIVNATYNSIENLIGAQIISDFEKRSVLLPNDIKSFLNPFTTNSSIYSSISYYTYFPFIGINTKTDIRGITTSFEYDALNRLKKVYNHNNDNIELIKYHYKNGRLDDFSSEIE